MVFRSQNRTADNTHDDIGRKQDHIPLPSPKLSLEHLLFQAAKLVKNLEIILRRTSFIVNEIWD